MKLNKFRAVSLLCFLLTGFIFTVPCPASTFPYSDIGDGKAATDVPLTLVDGVAVDQSGNVYISHRSKNRIRKVTPDGIITTIAGTGVAGFSGDNGPALEANLNFPAGLCVDSKGNLFVADRNNHRVRKIDTQGIIKTVAGNGIADMDGEGEPALEASLNFPSDVACAPNGELFISDRSNNRIRKVDSEGFIITVAGLGVPEFGGDFGPAEDAYLKYPFGIELAPDGTLYIADRGNNRVRKVDPSGTITTVAGDSNHFFSGDYGPATQASLAFPTDVALDNQGNLYISDRNNNRIRKVDKLGIITTVMGVGPNEYNGDNEVASETTLHLPFAVAVTPDQKLLIVDRSHFRVRTMGLTTGKVRTIAGNGHSLFKGDGGPGTGANLEAPTGIVVDSKGNLIFSDKQNHRIRTIDSKGFIHTLAGTGKEGNEGDGGPALKASVFLPGEMAIDSKDNIYFITPVGRSSLVRKIDANGTISTFAGSGRMGKGGDGGPATQASFGMLKDITIDSEGNMYLVDYTNRNIRKIDTQGIVSTVAEEAMSNLVDEEIHPNGIVVADDGTIYFSDSGSSKIRKISRDHTITTYAGNGSFKDSGDGGPAIEAGIRSPGGLLLTDDGDLLVSEEGTNRIRKIDSKGIITTLAGKGFPGFSGDGHAANEALIKAPYRLAKGKDGTLYFTDRDNNRVRSISSDGIISSIAGNDNFGWLQDGLEVRITVQNFP